MRIFEKKFRCKHCGATSALDDAGSNWNILGRRNGRQMFGCDCGHGLYVGFFALLFGSLGTTHVSPEEVEDQKYQMRKAGLNPDEKLPTAGDIKKAWEEAPPGDTHFEVGDRIIDTRGLRGTVKDIVEDDGKILLRVLFDKGYGNIVIGVDPVIGKIRRIQ